MKATIWTGRQGLIWAGVSGIVSMRKGQMLKVFRCVKVVIPIFSMHYFQMVISKAYPRNSAAMLGYISEAEAGKYVGLCFGLAGAAHYADDSYMPIDQVNVMENSLQSIGGLTQKLPPEEPEC